MAQGAKDTAQNVRNVAQNTDFGGKTSRISAKTVETRADVSDYIADIWSNTSVESVDSQRTIPMSTPQREATSDAVLRQLQSIAEAQRQYIADLEDQNEQLRML